MATLCRDCFSWTDDDGPPGARPTPCPVCRSGRRRTHPELATLTIAHIDCDAFYASVEKRDDPRLEGRPVIVGGGRRGVVSACCYIARINGVRSAMPMFKALKACPNAVVIRPDMAKYAAVGKQVRALMEQTTPLVEPLSIDEAFLDLSGTERVHKAPPAAVLARLVKRIEDEIGISASIGLAPNKFLAKMASDLDKPRGFSVIGAAEAESFLAEKSVRMIWGVGAQLAKRLEADGIHTIGQLRAWDEETLMRRYGSIGRRLSRFAHGRDTRSVDPGGAAKSISAETTLEEDERDADALAVLLWRLSEKVSRRLKRAGLGGVTVTLKLRTAAFKSLTRSRTLSHPTDLADDIFRTAVPLLRTEADGRAFRLIGVGVSGLSTQTGGGEGVSDLTDLADPGRGKRRAVETVMDRLRDQFGPEAIAKGRGFQPRRKDR
jgi:DNA polymerase-4